MKKFLVLLVFVIMSGISPSQSSQMETTENSLSVKITPQETDMPNIIYMIGDGWGAEMIKAASLVEYGIPNGTVFESFPHKSMYNTNNSRNEVTDSAAGGTSLATGFLTFDRILGMNEDGTVNYKTILEYLKHDFDYASGIITTSEMGHATPGAFTTHIKNRNPKGRVFDHLMEADVDVVLGGGLGALYVGGKGKVDQLGETFNYDQTVTSRAELLNINNTSGRTLGLFESVNMRYEADRNFTTDPNLVEMTSVGLSILSNFDDPFFVMIEGGMMDQAGHKESTPTTEHIRNEYAVLDSIVFEKAVENALNFAKADGNTIVVVGADHETGYFEVLDFSGLDDSLPGDETTESDIRTRRIQRTNQLDLAFPTNLHTATPVPFYGYGVDFSKYNISKITDIFWTLNHILGAFPVYGDYSIETTPEEISITIETHDQDESSKTIKFFSSNVSSTIPLSSQNIVFNNGIAENSFNYTISDGGIYSLFFEIEEVDGKSISSLDILVEIASTDPIDEDGDDNGLNYPFLPLFFGIGVLIYLRKVRKT